MTDVPTNEPQADPDQTAPAEPAVADPTDAGGASDAGPGPDDPAAANVAAPAPSFTVGQTVRLPRSDDADDDEPDRFAIVVGETPAAGDTPAIYDVAEFPEATGRYFGNDLRGA